MGSSMVRRLLVKVGKDRKSACSVAKEASARSKATVRLDKSLGRTRAAASQGCVIARVPGFWLQCTPECCLTKRDKPHKLGRQSMASLGDETAKKAVGPHTQVACASPSKLFHHKSLILVHSFLQCEKILPTVCPPSLPAMCIFCKSSIIA